MSPARTEYPARYEFSGNTNYRWCPHCDKDVSRSTLWRHKSRASWNKGEVGTATDSNDGNDDTMDLDLSTLDPNLADTSLDLDDSSMYSTASSFQAEAAAQAGILTTGHLPTTLTAPATPLPPTTPSHTIPPHPPNIHQHSPYYQDDQDDISFDVESEWLPQLEALDQQRRNSPLSTPNPPSVDTHDIDDDSADQESTPSSPELDELTLLSLLTTTAAPIAAGYHCAPIPTAQPLITWQGLDAEFLRDDEDPDADNDAEEIAAEDEMNHEAAMEDEDEQEAPASAAIAPGQTAQWDDDGLAPIWDLEAAQARRNMILQDDNPIFRSMKIFKLQMEVNLGSNAYQKMRVSFPELNFPALTALRSEMQDRTSIYPRLYDCCIDCCMCFVGPYATYDKCRFCKKDRFVNGAPVRQFQYISLIDQLKARYANLPSATAMRYRSLHELDNANTDDGTMDDITDSAIYKKLRTTPITVNGITPDPTRCYFDDPTDVLLSTSTDGFNFFRRGKHSAWPILFVNHNLSPTVRFRNSEYLCVGVIPKKPKDHDSFTYLVVEELARAALGVDAYDAVADANFKLRAFCPFACGDIPACAQAHTGGKHQGAIHPCRDCRIEGIRIKQSSNKSHYIPITRPTDVDYPASDITIDNLTDHLWTNEDWMKCAREVEASTTKRQKDSLAKQYGINRLAITTQIPGFLLPFSVPFDVMHLLSNTCSNYATFFSALFKGLDDGAHNYILPAAVWKDIGRRGAAGSLVPSSFGRRLPDIAQDRTFFTAEAYLIWTTVYSPVLLYGRWANTLYYDHWMRFVSIVERCTAFETTRDDRQKLREDIKQWYTEYESIFYQYKAERLPFCVQTTHAWLHVPDLMEHGGPLWVHWTWGTERYCGKLARAVSSRKYPHASLDRRVLEIAVLNAARHTYALEQRLPPYTAMYQRRGVEPYRDDVNYRGIVLLGPRRPLSLNTRDVKYLRNRIAIWIKTNFSLQTRALARTFVPQYVEQWGRIELDQTDIVKTKLGWVRHAKDERNASFVRYELLVDRNRARRRAPSVFVATPFFGEVQRALVVELGPSPSLNLTAARRYILVDIRQTRTEVQGPGLHSYTSFGAYEIVQGTSIMGPVGRIKRDDTSRYWYIKRNGAAQQGSYED